MITRIKLEFPRLVVYSLYRHCHSEMQDFVKFMYLGEYKSSYVKINVTKEWVTIFTLKDLRQMHYAHAAFLEYADRMGLIRS